MKIDGLDIIAWIVLIWSFAYGSWGLYQSFVNNPNLKNLPQNTNNEDEECEMKQYRFSFTDKKPFFVKAKNSLEATKVFEQENPNFNGIYFVEVKIADNRWKDVDDDIIRDNKGNKI